MTELETLALYERFRNTKRVSPKTIFLSGTCFCSACLWFLYDTPKTFNLVIYSVNRHEFDSKFSNSCIMVSVGNVALVEWIHLLSHKKKESCGFSNAEILDTTFLNFTQVPKVL